MLGLCVCPTPGTQRGAARQEEPQSAKQQSAGGCLSQAGVFFRKWKCSPGKSHRKEQTRQFRSQTFQVAVMSPPAERRAVTMLLNALSGLCLQLCDCAWLCWIPGLCWLSCRGSRPCLTIRCGWSLGGCGVQRVVCVPFLWLGWWDKLAAGMGKAELGENITTAPSSGPMGPMVVLCGAHWEPSIPVHTPHPFLEDRDESRGEGWR